MIRTNELRIGNYISDHMDRIKRVWTIKQGTILTSDYDIDDYEINGIPLTPEILEKLSFGLSDTFIWKKDDVVLVYEQWIFRYYYTTDKWRDVSYVHQLQNLCFALTGEELTYTP